MYTSAIGVVFNKLRIYHHTCRPRVTSFHSKLDRVSKRRTILAPDIVHCEIDFGSRRDSILTNGYTMKIFRRLPRLFIKPHQANPFNVVRRQLAMNKRRCFVTAGRNVKRWLLSSTLARA